jgi:hypothetical protein
VLSMLMPVKIGWGIFIFEIIFLGIIYFFAKGRPPIGKEKDSINFNSKKEEKDAYKHLGEGVLKLIIVFGCVFGGMILIFFIIGKLIK